MDQSAQEIQLPWTGVQDAQFRASYPTFHLSIEQRHIKLITSSAESYPARWTIYYPTFFWGVAIYLFGGFCMQLYYGTLKPNFLGKAARET